MFNFKNKSFLSTLVLSLSVFIFVSLIWHFGNTFLSFLTGFVMPQSTDQYKWVDLLFLLFLSLLTGVLVDKFGAKRLLPPVAIFLFVWFCLSIFAGKFMKLDLLFIPVLFTVSIIIFTIHLKKLWEIDSELTEKLVSLTSTGHLLEGKSADLRIESGLKLLETVLPLSEAIVFRIGKNNELNPIGRSKSDQNSSSPVLRQASWQENVELCEEVFKSRETVVRKGKNDKGNAKVALPLIYENLIIGVLYVNVHENFETEDQNLLEAFSGQLARNFQRKELRGKSLPHKTWWSSFSTKSAENRLDIISLIHSIFKEQSFSAVASSYLQEAHTIAYLDGTIGLYEPANAESCKYKRTGILQG